MTPSIREAIRSTIAGFVGDLDLIRTAVLDTTVSIAVSPAAFIVSPDSASGQQSSLTSVRNRTHQRDPQCRLQHLVRRQPQHSRSAR